MPRRGEPLVVDLSESLQTMQRLGAIGDDMTGQLTEGAAEIGPLRVAPDGLEILAACTRCGRHFDRLLDAHRLAGLVDALPPTTEGGPPTTFPMDATTLATQLGAARSLQEALRPVAEAAQRHTASCPGTPPPLASRVQQAAEAVLHQCADVLSAGEAVTESLLVLPGGATQFALLHGPDEVPLVVPGARDARRVWYAFLRAGLRLSFQHDPEFLAAVVSEAWMSAALTPGREPRNDPDRTEALTLWLLSGTHGHFASAPIRRLQGVRGEGPATLEPVVWQGKMMRYLRGASATRATVATGALFLC